MNPELLAEARSVVSKFTAWLERFGETSQDHQDFFASRPGRAAKALYYRYGSVGNLAVLPMVFCEAFLPSSRRFFYPKMRLPIADAHFAMGYALLHSLNRDKHSYDRAVHFLQVLEKTRCPGYREFAWGYPFDWQTRKGIIPKGTPLITTVPYCYEAFDYVERLDGAEKWRHITRSVADHGLNDYKDRLAGPDSATCTYTPASGEGVVNASAYRAFLLTHAALKFGAPEYRRVAEKNLSFVLECQLPNGAWPYATDGARDFVDHFHTCFVLKALAKIEKLTGHSGCSNAIERGIEYYVANLFDDEGLPKPFSKAPRLIVYRRELYDCAECLNLGVLLRGRFPDLDRRVELTLSHVLSDWVLEQGSFRSRKLWLGWDDVPMHRWGQSEMFRSLCLILADAAGINPMDHVLTSDPAICAE